MPAVTRFLDHYHDHHHHRATTTIPQRGNLEYFLQSGWVAPPPPAPGARPPHVTWVFTVAGEQCTPCGVAFPVT